MDLCHNSQATDGTQCQWCTASDQLIEVGICVTLAQVSHAAKVGLSCPTAEIDEGSDEKEDTMTLEEAAPQQLRSTLPDIDCFRAAWIADNAETACNTSQANDGSSCVWCQTKGDTMGACVSGSEATIANGQFGLSCPSVDVVDTEEDSIDEEFEGEDSEDEEDLLDAE